MFLPNLVVLKQLTNALQTLEAPYHRLPEAKDNDGATLTDVKDKRLVLVKEHLVNAMKTMTLIVDTLGSGEQYLISQLSREHPRDVQEMMYSLTGRGLPPGLLEVPEVTDQTDQNTGKFGF